MLIKNLFMAFVLVGAFSCYQEENFSGTEVEDRQNQTTFPTSLESCLALLKDQSFKDWPTKYQSASIWNWRSNKIHRETIQEYFEDAKEEFFPLSVEVSAPSLSLALKNCKERLILVDVREPEEREISKLSPSISIEEFEDLSPSERENQIPIFYCTIGHRSGLITQQYRKENVTAFNLKGGVLAWSHGILPFINEEGERTKEVHVFGPDWNFLEATHSPIY
jgi:rhodanese-related sulfurtransferase